MTTFKVNDIDVQFPYQPYQLQIDFISKVIESCETGKYALLESPTGTGKTLSLLCSILSWKQARGLKSQIIYSSRTHGQLSNVIKELKKTNFKPKISQIASRSYLCLNEDVKKLSSSYQSRVCIEHQMKKTCKYIDNEKIKRIGEDIIKKTSDLMEFKNACFQEGICPYFCAQKNLENSDLILTPYSYIVDPSVRINLPSNIFRNNILVVDEAHNFPEQCCEYFSISISFYSFKVVSDFFSRINIDDFIEYFRNNINFDISSFDFVSKSLNELYMILLDFNNHKSGVIEPSELYQLFEKAKITKSNIRRFKLLLTIVKDSFVSFGLCENEILHFDSVCQVFQSLFPLDKQNSSFINKYYEICIKDFELHMFCFTPAPAFQQLSSLQPRTIILTSGTISPFQSFIESFDTQFPIQLENPHIASSSNLYIAIASKGFQQTGFQFTFKNRTDENMKNDFSKCISELFEIVPCGLLTFFPSFSLLNELSNLLICNVKNGKKRIIFEPRNHTQMNCALKEFKSYAKQGAALFAVCRGKMSEGIDFSDDFARCVSIVGVPFPNLSDIKVETHKQWLERRKPGSGSRWYIETAIRAVNQAIGRAIRHKDDYAAIVLFDQRYEGLRNLISKWIRPSIHVGKSWEEIKNDLFSFYEKHRHKSSSSYITKVLVKSNSISESSDIRFFSNLAYHQKEEKEKDKNDNFQNGQFDEKIANNQMNLMGPHDNKTNPKSFLIKTILSQEERNQLCLILRNFKKTHDISLLKDEINKIKSNECKNFIFQTMNPNLKAKLLS